MDMIGQASTRYLEAVKSFPSKEPLILSLFKKYNTKYFKNVRIPYYLPTWIGGLGLYTEYTSKFISNPDLKIANLVMSQMKKGKFPRNLNHNKKQWLFWDLAEKKVMSNKNIEITTTNISTSAGCDLYDSEVAAEVFELFRHPETDLTKIFTGGGKKQEMKSSKLRDQIFKKNLRYNERLWDIKSYKSLNVTPVDARSLNRYEIKKTIRPPSSIDHLYKKSMDFGSLQGTLDLINSHSNGEHKLISLHDDRASIIGQFVSGENKKLYYSRVDLEVVNLQQTNS